MYMNIGGKKMDFTIKAAKFNKMSELIDYVVTVENDLCTMDIELSAKNDDEFIELIKCLYQNDILGNPIRLGIN